MGLDMYLERMPRYGDTTPREINAIESYLDWKRKKERKERNCTLEKWCGINYKDVPKGKVMEFYKEHARLDCPEWDTERRFERIHISEEVGYWRKANQIHNWFVENVQDGVDDCCYHDEVTKEILEELLDVCKRVLDSCELVNGKITNGYTFNEDGSHNPIMEDGQYVKDSSIAEELLPSTCGFFFGSTDYDEYYVDDIKHTIDIITKVLETTDFETQMVYYVSSW